MHTSRKWLLTTAALLALATGIALGLSRAPAPQPAPQLVATVFDAPRPLPAFRLTDENGASVARSDMKDGWSWLFFGFVSCPDVCPATLGIIASALEGLPEDQRPNVYLVSVDPERDTPPRLAPYVRHFDLEFHALTGELDQIEALASGLYATFAKVPLDNGDYTMDHFAGIYFVNDQANVVAVSTSPHLPDQLAADYLTIRN